MFANMLQERSVTGCFLCQSNAVHLQVYVQVHKAQAKAGDLGCEKKGVIDLEVVMASYTHKHTHSHTLIHT